VPELLFANILGSSFRQRLTSSIYLTSNPCKIYPGVQTFLLARFQIIFSRRMIFWHRLSLCFY
jgi:hypothetical protein